MKYNGFTLAEVLITLGIIGVVAAMTLPSVISNYKKEVLHKEFLKTYSDLGNVAKLFEVHEGMSVHDYSIQNDNIGGFASNITLDAFMKYFNGKTKQSARIAAVIPTEKRAKALNGESTPTMPCDESGFVKEVSGKMYVMDNAIKEGGFYTKTGPKICVDINGDKLPNKYGYDWFVFTLDENNFIKPYIGISLVGNSDVDLPAPQNYCNYTINQATYTCAYYALQDKSPLDDKKSYWKDFLK